MSDESNRTAPEATCWVGLLAASMALMTAHASPQPGAKVEPETLRPLRVRRILGHLRRLTEHPHAPPGLRSVAGHLHARWSELAGSAAAPGDESRACHATDDAMRRLH